MDDLRYLYGVATLGGILAFFGVALLGRSLVANLFGGFFILTGLFIAFYGPAIWNFWIARCLSEQPGISNYHRPADKPVKKFTPERHFEAITGKSVPADKKADSIFYCSC